MSVVIKDVRVLTLDDKGTEFACADIVVNGGKIIAIGPGAAARSANGDARVIDGHGKLAMPGLINAHFHSPGNLMKGALVDTPLEIFMLYEVPPLSSGSKNPRHNYVRTALGAMEMLKRGITSVQDDAYHVPTPYPDGIDAIMEGYRDSGMRARVSIDQPNVVEYEKYPYLADIVPADVKREMEAAPRQSGDELIELYQWFIDRWEGAGDGRLGTAVSCSAPQRVDSDYLAELATLSRRYNLPHYIHVLETKLQRVLGEKKFGKSLVAYLNDNGILNEYCNIIHAIWVDEDDLDLLADSGCTVSHQPLCNMKLGSGVMPFREMRNRNIPICLGTDESNTDDTTNMWMVGKAAGLVHKLSDQEYRNWPLADEILTCLTRGGARAMRMNDRIGVLAEGYDADLILVDLDTLNFTPLNDLRRQLVFCEDGSSVALTMVAGKVVYEDGALVTLDEAAIKAEVREIMNEYGREIEAIHESAKRLEPYYREMYLTAVRQDVGMNRWVGLGGGESQ